MDNIHLQVLSFANDNPDGITLAQLESKFPDDFKWIEREIDNKNLFTHGDKGPWNDGKLYLSFDDRFKLLEHEELKNANKSSKTATIFATAALIVSIFSAATSVYFSIQKKKPEIILNESQLQQLLTIKNTKVDKQLESLIQKQEETTQAVNTIITLPNNSPNKLINKD